MASDYQLDKKDYYLIRKLLLVEYKHMASQLGLINRNPTCIIDGEIPDLLGLIDELSRNNDEQSHKITTVLSGLLWRYKNKEWTGIRDFLLVRISGTFFVPKNYSPSFQTFSKRRTKIEPQKEQSIKVYN